MTRTKMTTGDRGHLLEQTLQVQSGRAAVHHTARDTEVIIQCVYDHICASAHGSSGDVAKK